MDSYPPPPPHDDDPPAPRRLGTGMVVAAWAVAIALLVSLFSGLLDGQRNPNGQVAGIRTDTGVAEVRLVQNRQGHYIASGLINGEPVVFLLDTGATDVSVPARLARRLNLKRGAPMQAQTANGVVTTYRTRLASVALGTISMSGVRAHINPGMTGDEVLLGMSFLRDLELSQREGLLTLRQRPRS